MRTRGQISAAVKPDTPLLQILPENQVITISNASSFLLKLPQEIKNDIYELVLGGNCIHVEAEKNKDCPYRLYRCVATSSDTAAQKNFDSAVALPAVKFDPHQSCTKTPWCWEPSGINCEPQPAQHLSVDLLRTCREVYAEARHILYTVNTLSFQDPKLLCRFIHDCKIRGGHNVAMRSLRLHMGIRRRKDEEAWNLALRTISQSLSGLISIHISIEQLIWLSGELRRHLPLMGMKKKFLTALEELKTLKLKDVTIIVDDFHRWEVSSKERFYWTHAQKQEWARMIKAAMLGKDAVLVKA